MHRLHVYEGKQKVSSTSELQTVATEEQSDNVENDMESCTSSSHTDSEAERSGWMTHISRRSKRIATKSATLNVPCQVNANEDWRVAARKRHVSSADVVKKKKMFFECDVDGCSYATEKLQSLVTHRLSFHSEKIMLQRALLLELLVKELQFPGKENTVLTAKSVASNVQMSKHDNWIPVQFCWLRTSAL